MDWINRVLKSILIYYKSQKLLKLNKCKMYINFTNILFNIIIILLILEQIAINFAFLQLWPSI